MMSIEVNHRGKSRIILHDGEYLSLHVSIGRAAKGVVPPQREISSNSFGRESMQRRRIAIAVKIPYLITSAEHHLESLGPHSRCNLAAHARR